MSRRKTSLAEARITGRLEHDKKRFTNRGSQDDRPLGDPPGWMPVEQQGHWRDYALRWPWLRMSHRALLEIICHLSARMANGTLGVAGLNLLRQCIQQAGGTPVTAGVASLPEDDDDDDTERLFRR